MVGMKRVLVHVVIIALLAILPIFLNHAIGYLPLFCYVFALGFGCLYVFVLRRGVVVSFENSAAGENCEGGGEQTSCTRPSSHLVSCIVENKSALPLIHACLEIEVLDPIVCADRAMASQTSTLKNTSELKRSFFSLPARKTLAHECFVPLQHVGVHSIVLRSILLRDPIGLVNTRAYFESETKVVCAPSICQIDSQEFEQAVMHESEMPERSVISDGFDYAGVREYAFGDPIKSVHWKLSARHEGLQTRLFEIDVNKRMAILLDFHAEDTADFAETFKLDKSGKKPSASGVSEQHIQENKKLKKEKNGTQDYLDINDAIVECGLSCATMAQNGGVDVRLCYSAKQGTCNFVSPPNDDELAHFTKELPVLNDDISTNCASFSLSECANRKNGFDNIVICTSALTHSLIESVLEINSMHISITVIYIVSRYMLENKKRECDESMGALVDAGVFCTCVCNAEDLRVGVSA